MKILRIYLQHYRVLDDFSLSLEAEKDTLSPATYSIDFLVGVNGTGKSTLLRAIAEIFQRLEAGRSFNFGFEITYQLGDDTKVFISNLAEDTHDLLTYLQLRLNDGAVQLLNNDQVATEYLPELVIAFTTGSEDEWELGNEQDGQLDTNLDNNGYFSDKLDKKATDQLVEQYLSEIPGATIDTGDREDNEGERLSLSNYLFIKPYQIPLLILCGLLADLAGMHDSNTSNRLHEALKEVKIAALQGFSLKFRMFNGVTAPDDINFVRTLAGFASQRLRSGPDYLLVYDLSSRDRVALARNLLSTEEAGSSFSGLGLFRRLAQLFNPLDDMSVLREINLFLSRPPSADVDEDETLEIGETASPLHLLKWFSDGEQSFLGRLCLFSLLGGTEALILLDEPEVHFNDYWKREIVRILDDALRGRRSHVLLTSHSSITLTDVPRDHIRILRRNSTYTQGSAVSPRIKTLAADPSDIIIHVFGAKQATGSWSIKRILEGLEKIQNRSSDMQVELLEGLLQDIGPGYWSFLVRRRIEDIRIEQQMEH